MMTDRPIRLTFTGEVESYNPSSRQWIPDLSRDPREYISLGMPPAASAGLSAFKTTCANAITHQLRQSALNQGSVSWSGGTQQDIEPSTWDTTFYSISNIVSRSGRDLYAVTDGSNIFFHHTYLITAEWWHDLDPDDLDDTFWDKVTCHLWCFMSDDCTFTYINWQELIQAVFDDATLGDGQQWLKLMLILLGRKGLTNLGYLKINDGDVGDPGTDCECA